MITAILVDDDQHLRTGLKALLDRYTNDIAIIGEADSVKTGIAAISKLKPQVIFLDIHLSDGTGFDILEKLSANDGKINAHIIFITAHEQYAVKAFRFSALDFLLKPVDFEELQHTMAKIKEATAKHNNSFEHIDLLLENIRKKVDHYKRIALSTSDGIHLFEVADIIRCEAKVNYTQFFIKNHKPVLISRTLKEYEELLTEHGFERVQSHLINLAYLKSYIKNNGGYVIMADNSNIPIAQSKKEKLQELIKAL